MIDIELVVKKYSSMSDDKLIEFAKKEQYNITDSAVEVLLIEIQKRGLDDSFLRRISAGSTQQNKASYWRAAFDERKSGKSSEETIKGLIEKGASEYQANLILKRIPNFEYKNEEFDELLIKSCSNATFISSSALLFVFGIGIFFILTGITTFSPLSILAGVAFSVVGFILYSNYKGEFKGSQFWLELIKSNQDKIVWIKPILEKHTIGFVFTLFEVKKFQFLTNDNINITIECDSEAEQRILFEGVRNYLPHVHIGYSLEILEIYEQDPTDFIRELHMKNLYTPLDKVKY